MNEIPDLPFENILSYLSLADLLKARAVCRRWCEKIDNFRVNSLGFSQLPIDFISAKRRWLGGVYTENFIHSRQFSPLFDVFGSTILRDLKYLRFCDLTLNEVDHMSFASSLNSFGKLQELYIIHLHLNSESIQEIVFDLNLPMLQIIHLEKIAGVARFCLDAAKLRKISVFNSFFLRMDFAHSGSVETLVTNCLKSGGVERFKNIKYLYCQDPTVIDSALLYQLRHLNELHLGYLDNAIPFVPPVQLANLKVFQLGLPSNVDNSELSTFDSIEDAFGLLAANLPRLADEIRFYRGLNYSKIERAAPGSQVEILNRFTDLNHLSVGQPVQDVDRLLYLLKNSNISDLLIGCDQPQDLYDRLPEHSALQKLSIEHPDHELIPQLEPQLVLPIQHPVNHFEFLFRSKHLNELYMDCAVDSETIRRICTELPFLTRFEFMFINRNFPCATSIKIERPQPASKLFRVNRNPDRETIVTTEIMNVDFTDFTDLNLVIEFIEADLDWD